MQLSTARSVVCLAPINAAALDGVLTQDALRPQVALQNILPLRSEK